MFSRGYASFLGDFGGFVGNLILSRETQSSNIVAIPSLDKKK